jgi:glucose-1-phosphate cytidylyltransferase
MPLIDLAQAAEHRPRMPGEPPVLIEPAAPAEPAPPVVLLCGGAGDYIAEAGVAVPKPLIRIAGRPLLIHIMRQFACHGSTEFVVALAGPGQQQVKDYLLRLESRSVNFTIHLGSDPTVRLLDELPAEGWTITCADSGDLLGTGTRLRDAAPFVPRWPVVAAYGNGLADVDLPGLLEFHRAHGRLATVAVAVPPDGPDRVALAGDGRVVGFGQPPRASSSVVSTGVFVLEEAAVEGYIPPGADVMLEAGPVRDLIADGELMAYRHHGYWRPVDTWEDVAAVRRSWPSGAWPCRPRPGRERSAPERSGPERQVGPAGRAAAETGAGADGARGTRLAALTSRELQVAALVGECLTNRAIARRLSVAEKTVEMHLTKIFGKLTVSSRTELASLMILARQAAR